MPATRGLLSRFLLIIAVILLSLLSDRSVYAQADLSPELRDKIDKLATDGERGKDRLPEGLRFGATRTKDAGNFRDAIQYWLHQQTVHRGGYVALAGAGKAVAR